MTPTAIFGAGAWTWADSLALTVRYQVPIIPVVTHERWEASNHRLPIGVTAEQYALGLTLYSGLRGRSSSSGWPRASSAAVKREAGSHFLLPPAEEVYKVSLGRFKL